MSVFDNQCYMATGDAHGNRRRHGFGRHGQRSRHRELLFGRSLNEFEREARAALQRKGLSYIVAKVEAAGQRMSTDMDGKEGKYRFVRYIERTEGIKSSAPRQNSHGHGRRAIIASPPSRWTAAGAFCPTNPFPFSATLRRTLRRLEISGPPPTLRVRSRSCLHRAG